MKALEKLRAWLDGEGRKFIKPPVVRFAGFTEDHRITPKGKRRAKSNVSKFRKAAEK